MPSDPQHVQSVFLAAAEKPPSERAAFLHAQCGVDAELQQRVEALLRAHDEPGSILNLSQVLPCAALDPADIERPGTQIGPYKLLEQIGEGGMGVVYMAQQSQPIKRRVAVKIVKPGMDSRQVIARFEAERQALAMMDHPNIAKVLDAGQTEKGRPYFVMELIRGIPITEYCDCERLDTRRRLLLFTDVCRAVQHAHTKAIIHRDLKPSNVLVTLHDGVPVVKVIDFGVAKALNQELTERTMFTQFSQLVGTPLYMSPEQAELSGLDIDTRSDIYSLGVMLYELLTSTTPFAKDQLSKVNFDEMRRMIREDEPPRPSHRISTLAAEALSTVSHNRSIDSRRMRQHLRSELDWIVMKCLEKDRNRRYESANSLARDVERYLNDLPVEASPPSRAYRWKKAVRRNRGAFATALLLMLSMIVGTVASQRQAYLAHHARQLADERLTIANHHERQAVAAAQRAQSLLYMSDMNLAFEAANEGDSRRAADLLRRHIPGPQDEDLRGFEWHLLQQTVNVTPHILMDLNDYVWGLKCSPDGTRLAAACNDGKLRVCEMPTGRLLHEFDCVLSVKAACWSHDGKFIAAAIADGSVRGWDLHSSTQRFSIQAHEGEVNGVLLADNDSTLITCGIDGTIRSWDFATGERKAEYKGHERSVESIAVSPDQKWLASASSDFDVSVSIWNRESGKQIHKLKCNTRAVSVTFSPTGSHVVASAIDGTILLADVQSGSHQVLQKCIDGVESVVLLDGGRLLAAGDRGGAIRLWSLGRPIDAIRTVEENLKQGSHWIAHQGRIETLAVRPGTSQFLSSGRDGRILLWNPDLERTRWEVAEANDLVVSRRGELLSVDDDIRTWNLDSRQLVQSFGRNMGNYLSIARSSDGQYLVTATADTVVVYNRERQEVARINAGTDCVKVCLSHDGSLVAVSCRSASDFVNVYRRGQSQPFRQFTITSGSYIRFSPDDTVLAAGSLNDVLLFDLVADQPPRRLQAHSNALCQFAFSPDGTSLASVSDDRKLMLWDWRSGQLRWSVDAHRSEVSSVAFAPDGRTLATGDNQGEIRFWHAATGQPIGGFRPEQGVIDQLVFTLDSRRLIARQENGAMTVYDSLPTTKTLDDITESPYFTAIPGLSDPGTRIEELAVSGNGLVVAGSGRKDGKAFGFRWTFDEGTSVLPSSTVVDVRCVNFDGSRILAARSGVGVCWDWPFLKQSLVLSGERPVNVSDVDASGTVIVGEVAGSAVRGNLGRFSTLPALGPDVSSTATAVSTDGSTVFGVAWPKLSKRHTLCRPVRWTGQSADFLPGAEDQNHNWIVECASADGRAIAGYRWPTAFGEDLDAHLNMAYHWEDGRVTLLGDLSGGSIASRATGISGDGQLVVGKSHSKNGWEAFIWDQEHGMRSLEQVLLARGAELTGWKLEVADDISHDGSVIVGKGVNPNGRYQTYVARLPREALGIDTLKIERIHSIVVKATQKETVTNAQRQKLLTTLFKLSEHDPQQFVAGCRSLGDQLVALNEQASAVVIYSEALKFAPHDSGLYLARGRANFPQNGFVQAASDISTAIENLPKDDELQRETLLVNRGFSYCRLERFDEALADFEAAYEIAPLYTLKLLAEGFNGNIALTNTGIPNSALTPGVVKLVDRAESLTSDEPAEVRRARVMLLAQFDQFQLASKEYEVLLAAREATEIDYYSLALLAVAQNDVSGYQKWCAAMDSKFPSSSSYYRFLCHALAPEGTKSYPLIIAAARLAAAKPPTNATQRTALGAVLVRDGQYNEGYKLLNAAVASNATGGTSQARRARYCLLAISHSNRGLNEKAHSYLVAARQSVRSFQQSARPWQPRLLLNILLREATQLIEPQPALGPSAATPGL